MGNSCRLFASQKKGLISRSAMTTIVKLEWDHRHKTECVFRTCLKILVAIKLKKSHFAKRKQGWWWLGWQIILKNKKNVISRIFVWISCLLVFLSKRKLNLSGGEFVSSKEYFSGMVKLILEKWCSDLKNYVFKNMCIP